MTMTEREDCLLQLLVLYGDGSTLGSC